MKNKQIKKPTQQKHPLTKTSKTVNLQKNRSYFDLLGIALIIILGIIIYSNSFNCSFHFDDTSSIVDNTAIRNISDIKSIWNYSNNRFVAYFTFALNYHYGKLDVWGYHLVNLMIHLATSIIVWWLTLLIFSAPVLKDKDISKHKKMIALFTALLFVSHPLATQSVTYIVQRLASMVAMFYLLSLALYVKARLIEKRNLSKYMLFAGAMISAILTMLTKENAFTLPVAIFLFEIFFFKTKKFNVNIKDYRVLLLISGVLSFIVVMFLKFSSSIFDTIPPGQGNLYSITPTNYLLTQFSVIVKYVQLLFLPINQNLDYDFPLSNSFFEIRTLLSFVGLLSLIILAVYLFKKHKIISFGIFWFFLTLSVESSIIPIKDVIFEHRTYLPSFGFFLIIIYVFYTFLWKKYQFIGIFIVTIIVIACSILAFQRNKVWEDDLTLWSDVIVKSPNKARPLNNRGLVYKNMKQWDKAIADYSKTIAIDPKYTIAYSNRGVAFSNLKQWDKAIADYTKVIEMEPKLVAGYNNRGSVYGNLGLWDKSIADFSKAVEINPNFKDSFFNRANTYGNIKQWDKAIADYSSAIKIDPRYIEAYNFRGFTYMNMQQWDKAITDFNKVIEIEPNYKEAYANRDIAVRKLKSLGK